MAVLKPYGGIYPKVHESVYLSDNVFVIGDVEIGEDSSVWFGAVVRGDVNYIRIGKRTNIQDNSVVHVTHETAPTIVGDDVTVGHRVILHGCVLGNNILVGMGAIVMDGAQVSDNVIIGAGALITQNKKIPEGVLVAGVPAKIVRDLKPEEIEMISLSAKNYVHYKNTYLQSSSPSVSSE